MIDLYAWKSANGRRPIIMLEETATPYRLIPIDPHGGDNRKPEYLKISPGGKVPCLVDPDKIEGTPIHLISFSALNVTRDLEKQCRDLLAVLDNHLATHDYFAGDYSIADMMSIGRFGAFGFDFIDLNDYPNLCRWRDRVLERPAVRKAMDMPIG